MNGDLFHEQDLNPKENGAEPATFFPCNREDAILLLGGLCIPTGFPGDKLRLAICDGRPARLPDGLREEEAILLNGGNPVCFPVLLELGEETGNDTGTIRYPDIRKLVFRTQEEANAFIFRPFDEFDPSEMAHDVMPERFGLPGAPRFTLRENGSDAHARLADRVAAGIHYVLVLAERFPACMNAAITFLGGGPGNNGADTASVRALIAALSNDGQSGDSRAGRIIAASFLKMDLPSPPEMLDCLDEEFAMHESDDPEIHTKESRWLHILHEVVANRRMLSKEILGDEGAVLYRGALLATMTDTPEAIGSFLSQDSLAGPRVCCMAAFLTGLKTGVIGMPWRLKKRQTERLAGLLDRLLTPPFSTVLETENVRQGDKQYTTVRCGNTPLLSLEATTESEDGELQPDRLSDDEQTITSSTGQWLDLDDDFRVEVRMNESAGFAFPTLFWSIPKTRSPIRQTDIRAFHECGGKLWYLRHNENGQWLACDLPSPPRPEHLPMLAACLKQAICDCLKPEKKKKPASKGVKKAKTAKS